MKSFIDLELVPTIPHLIEEVLDFKIFIMECIAKGNEALEGHTKAQKFKFFVDSYGCPMMKYRILYSDNDWLPRKVVVLNCGKRMRKENHYGHVLNLLH
jgi:hypothetical protein